MERELRYPEYVAEADRANGDVRLRFRVPASKYGSVVVILDGRQASALVGVLAECAWRVRVTPDA